MVWVKQILRPTSANGLVWLSASLPSGASGRPTGPSATLGEKREVRVALVLTVWPGVLATAVLVMIWFSLLSVVIIRKVRLRFWPGFSEGARTRRPWAPAASPGCQVLPLPDSSTPPLAEALPGT